MEARDAEADGGRKPGDPRVIRDVRDILPEEVGARLDSLVGRYESRIAKQRDSLTHLVNENARLRDMERSLKEKVSELESELGQLRRDAQGRGSW